ncbi:MAG: type I DNA topoisomerase [Candidatus Kapabacteria bacterium]|nr:type I DNA topoisomerase [Candidatus Kapabacteria bacterium]
MSKKNLIVVESPAKAKTINKYLGSNYIVTASVGHIKDLVKVNLGVDINNNFQPRYTTIKGKADIIKKIKQLAETASNVFIATDPDREGEAIAWHLAEEIKTKNKNIKRVLFNEITKTGIQKGIAAPREIDEALFMSQQARRVMDRLIGFQVSPFLSRAMLDKTTKSLSAGRVQSVALRLICEREQEISNFKPIEYWNITGDFATENAVNIRGRLTAADGKLIKNPEGSASAPDEKEQADIDNKLNNLNYIKNESEALALLERIYKDFYKIGDINKKLVKRRPQPPFTTSSLQQEASKRLGFSNSKTMQIAQKLYEGATLGKEGLVGLITYMRTDSVRISPEAQKAAQDFINSGFGQDFLPDSPPVYVSKSSNVQDAHEAIRPTTLEYTPKEIANYLSKDEALLYELIYNRFLASQMCPASIEQTTIEIFSNNFNFRASGSVVIFKGYLAIYDDIKDENKSEKEMSGILPNGLKEKDDVKLSEATPNQSFTKAPPRFNEASLVKELDELGIGRPSTYAQIVTTLIEREYVELAKKNFSPTLLGEDVSKILVKNFPALFNVDFTAKMEEELDTIGEGTNTYSNVLTDFYEPFSKSLKYAEEKGEIPEIKCELCGSDMIIKVSRMGRFLACSAYPTCKSTKPLPKIDNTPKAEPVIAEGILCEVCGKQMYLRQGKFGNFYGCVDYPKCSGTKAITTGVHCPKCSDGKIIERYSKKAKKKFYGCSRYPNCDYITNHEPLNQKCIHCGNPYIEVRFKKVDSGFEKYLKCPACNETIES